MSFILDALRKSEIERQRQSGPSMAEFPVARPDRRFPIALLAIGILLGVNLVVLLYFMLRSDGNSEDAASARQVAAVAPAAATSAPPAGTAASATAAAVTPSASSPASMSAQGDQPAATAAPGSVTYAQDDLYAADPTLPPEAPDPTLLPQAPGASAAGGVAYSAAPGGIEDAATVEAQTGLPPLTVDLHVFTDDPAKRAVFINGRRYTQGGTLIEGPIVEQITRDGAVLSYRGRRFLLPRL